MTRTLLILLALGLTSQCVFAAVYALPDSQKPRLIAKPWEPGVTVGVMGGIAQYRPGGASERTTEIDVRTSVPGSSYIAAASSVSTTGTVSSGTTALSVASATSWAVGNGIAICGRVEITFTTGASTTGKIFIGINGRADVSLDVTAGDTPEDIANNFAALPNLPGTVESVALVSGDDWKVTFAQDSKAAATGGDSYYFINYDISLVPSGPITGVAATVVCTLEGYHSRVTAISGTNFTLAHAAPATHTSVRIEHNDVQAIQDACDYASTQASGLVVALGTGYTYRIDSAQLLFNNGKQFTLRGGTGTKIDFRGGFGGITVKGSDAGTQPQTATIVSGQTKGSSTLTLQSGQGNSYAANEFVQLRFANDYTIPVISVGGTDNWPADAKGVTKQMVRITSKTSDTITFEPPLLADYTATPQYGAVNTVSGPLTYSDRVGIEEIWFDATNGDVGQISAIRSSINCWIYKCKFTKVDNYALGIDTSLWCEVNSSHYDRTKSRGSNHFGIAFNASTACLAVNNIVDGFQPLHEDNGGSIGCATLYSYYTGMGAATDYNVNHGAHNRYNLTEGNYLETGFISDGYFGSASHMTVFRNWIAGVNREAVVIGGTAYWHIFLRRFARHFYFVGNQNQTPGYIWPYERGYNLGKPNMGNESDNGGTQTGNSWPDFQRAIVPRTLSQSGTTVTSATDIFVVEDDPPPATAQRTITIPAESTFLFITDYIDARNVTVDASATRASFTGYIWANQPGYQEVDLDVESTTVRKDNYYVELGGKDTVNESIGSDTLPTSIAYGDGASKPTWWTDEETELGVTFTWPPIDPNSPNFSQSFIPAGYKFQLTQPPVIGGATINTAGTTITLNFNKAAEFGAGGSGGFVITNVAPACTMTYASGSGTSTWVYNLSRVMLEAAEESPRLNYTQPGNGVEDASGNDLESVSGYIVNNGSLQIGDVVEVLATTFESTTTDTIYLNYYAGMQPLTITAAGIINRGRVYIAGLNAESVGGNISMGIYSLSGSTATNIAYGAGVTTGADRWHSVDMDTPVHVDPGTYLVGFFGATTGPYFRGTSSGSAASVFSGTIADYFDNFPTFNWTTELANNPMNKTIAVGVRMVLDEVDAPAHAPGPLRSLRRR